MTTQPGVIIFTEGTVDPSASPIGTVILYSKTDDALHLINAAGTVSTVGAGGSVTTVSVTTANGVSGTVATASTTPAITLTLGAITPTSVAASGSVSGSNLSGTNTGNQTITLTGDVTGTGTSSFATTLATVNSNVGSFTNCNVTVNAKGLITAVSSGSGSGGTVSSVDMSVPTFLSVSGNPVTSSGTLAVTYSGTALPLANGGTGQTTASAAFNGLSPITTTGDLIYSSSGTTNSRLAIGSNAQVLTVSGGVPVWSAATPSNQIVAVKPSTTARTNNTSVIDPDLQCVLGIGTWSVDMGLFFYCTSSGAQGINTTVQHSGTILNSRWTTDGTNGGTAVTQQALNFGTGIGSLTLSTSSTSPDYYRLTATCQVTVSGTFGLWWGQQSTNAVPTNLLVGSWMILTKLA